MSSPPQHLYSAAVGRKSYSNQKKTVVACFIPGRTRLDSMAINERGVESLQGLIFGDLSWQLQLNFFFNPQVCLSRDMTLFDLPLHPFSSRHWHCTLSRDKPSKRCHALHYSCWAKNTITTRHEMIKNTLSIRNDLGCMHKRLRFKLGDFMTKYSYMGKICNVTADFCCIMHLLGTHHVWK